ncbi:MAG: flagellar assembly protein FliW [Gemmatimonadales bacterium]|nr:flagellar assembly protein FliW [Gemmatimonadales bacterium]
MTAPAADSATLSVTTHRFGRLTFDRSQCVLFADGLPGFSSCRAFVLLPTAVDALVWLQSLDHPDLALLLLTPDAIEDGRAAIPETLRRDGILSLVVVTLPGQYRPGATVNLKAPIVVDRAAGTGRQIILPDSPFGVAHPFALEALVTRGLKS